MKILIVTHYFNPYIGGIEIVAYNQTWELIKKDIKWQFLQVSLIAKKLLTLNEEGLEQQVLRCRRSCI